MDYDMGEDVKRMESRTYIIGREGHIYINDPTVSKQHAEIQVINGEVYLRDLGSTNGTFLIKNNRLVPFHEGYVQLHQPIVNCRRLRRPVRHLGRRLTDVLFAALLNRFSGVIHRVDNPVQHLAPGAS
jgi:hypothetical protein